MCLSMRGTDECCHDDGAAEQAAAGEEEGTVSERQANRATFEEMHGVPFESVMMLIDTISATHGVIIPIATVAGWTDEQRREAFDWAVGGRDKPAFVQQ